MKTRILAGLAIATLAMAPAWGDVIVLDFEGLEDYEAVGDFYNGGGGEDKDYDIEFSEDTLALVDADAGGNGNFANEPSPDTVMFFLNANNAILNVLNGFTTGFSFYYTSSLEAVVRVWSGLDATGELLAELFLDAQYSDGCTGDPSGQFCNWTPVGVLFEGTAFSIDFGGTANQVGFDDITFGSNRPGDPGVDVPEPGTLALLGLGLVGLGFARRRRAT